MKRFTGDGQRVWVRAVGEFESLSLPVAAVGAVVRMRRGDDGAWIRLDRRQQEQFHPFGVGDERENHVLAYPENCDAVRS